MPSWQARVANSLVRVVIRRKYWGDGPALVRRARRLLGAPPVVRFLQTHLHPGVRVEPVAGAVVRGEWVVPGRAAAGVLLYVHGGGFVCCSAATHRPITTAVARLTERRVFSVDYRPLNTPSLRR